MWEINGAYNIYNNITVSKVYAPKTTCTFMPNEKENERDEAEYNDDDVTYIPSGFLQCQNVYGVYASEGK